MSLASHRAIPGIAACLMLGAVAGCGSDVDEKQVDAWIANEGYVEGTTLAEVATSGSYEDLSGTPGLEGYASADDLAAVATSGAYGDLSGAPVLAEVATSGSYADLEGAPDLSVYAETSALAPVATSGAYGDLSGAPVLADVATSGSYDDLEGAPDLSVYAEASALAPVATSGAYGDLSGAPVLAGVAVSGAYGDLSGAPVLADVATSGAYEDLSGAPVLADVATSGSYDDLSDAPWRIEADRVTTDLEVSVPERLEVGMMTLSSDDEAGRLSVPGRVVIDQSYAEAPFAGGNLNPWQSFTAGRSGALVSLGVVALGAQDVTVVIYAGEGTGGPMLYSGSHHMEAMSPFFDVALDPPPMLEAGQVYTWQIQGNTLNFGIAIPGNYPGGRSNGHPDWDLAFRTQVATPDGLITLAATGVGIGVESPEYALHVAGIVAGTGPYMQLSDGRMKQDVAPLDEGLGAVMALRPVTWSWTDEARSRLHAGPGRESGFIAQEVQGVAPEAVRTDSQGLHAMSYGALVPVLTRAIQQQQEVIDRQNDQIEALERRLEALERRTP